MRVNIAGVECEVRIQERNVTFCDIMKGGKIIASDYAIQNPKDERNLIEGVNLAVARAFHQILPNAPRYRHGKVEEIMERFSAKLARQEAKRVAQFRQAYARLRKASRITHAALTSQEPALVKPSKVLAFLGGLLGTVNYQPAREDYGKAQDRAIKEANDAIRRSR